MPVSVDSALVLDESAIQSELSLDESDIQSDIESDQWIKLLKDISNDDDSNYEDMKSILESNIPIVDLEVHMHVDKNAKYTVCPKCNIECTETDNSICCSMCGLETSIISDDTKFSFSANDHNVSNNSFMSFNFIGQNSYCYQRSLMKTCSDYSKFRQNNNRKDLYNYNYRNEGKKIPKNAIKLAIEIFSTIKNYSYTHAGKVHNYVYRGNGKKGVLGACLFYACVINHITKTPRDIAAIMEIEERFLSKGDREVQKLNEKGVISIPTIIRPLNDYIDQYFPALNIPDKYKKFVFDIIDRVEKKNIHIVNDSRPTTKCIGAIYLLVNRVSSLNHITKDKIVTECKISKSTFNRYYTLLLLNYKKIKPVFVKHRIPQPISWRL